MWDTACALPLDRVALAVRALGVVVRAAADCEQQRFLRAARESWRQYAEEALLSGASRAHALVRDPGPPECPAVLDNGGASWCPHSLLLADWRKWQSLWSARPEPADPAPLFAAHGVPPGVPVSAPGPAHHGTALEPLIAKQLACASAAFPGRTTAADGWHPKHFRLLQPETLGGLASILNASEQLGFLPSAMRHIQVALIGAKRRPIGLFPSVFRLWGRCRAEALKAWEEVHASQPT